MLCITANLTADDRDGSLASKAAEAVRPCTSATPPKADVNSPPWLPPLSANWRPEQVQQSASTSARLRAVRDRQPAAARSDRLSDISLAEGTFLTGRTLSPRHPRRSRGFGRISPRWP